MHSYAKKLNSINLPLVEGEFPMIPFDLKTLTGLPEEFKHIAKAMLKRIEHGGGKAYFTLHGKRLRKGETLRRGGAHVDGNYEPHVMDFGGGGWKVGQEGRDVNHPTHIRQFNSTTGGIVICSNYHACNGWIGEYEGLPNKGGDCTHLALGESFELEPDTVYYGNNHFIHESLPMSDDVHRVMARITLPEDHVYS
tara:strand:- start:1491 stop:2075 length:585 start_codon:yes stop_codon:yes gene_type:complete